MPINERTSAEKKAAMATFIPAIMAMENAVSRGGDLNALPEGWTRLHSYDYPLMHYRADLYEYRASPEDEPQFFCLQRSVKNLEDVFFNTLPVLSRDASFSNKQIARFLEQSVDIINQRYAHDGKRFSYTDLNQLGYSQGGYLMGFALGYIYNKTGDVPEQIFTLDSAGETVALKKSIDVFNSDAETQELGDGQLTPDRLPDLIEKVHHNAAGIFVYPPNLINSAGARLGKDMWASPFDFTQHDAEKLLSKIDAPASPVEWLVGFLIYHTSELLFEKHRDEFPTTIEPETLLKALKAFCYSYAVTYTEQSHLIHNHWAHATYDMDRFLHGLIEVNNRTDGYSVPGAENFTFQGDPANSYFYYMQYLHNELLQSTQARNMMGDSDAEAHARRKLEGTPESHGKDGYLSAIYEAQQAGMDYEKIQRLFFQPALQLVQKVVNSIPFRNIADDMQTAIAAGKNSHYHRNLPRWAAVGQAALESLLADRDTLEMKDSKFIITELIPHLIKNIAPVKSSLQFAEALQHEVRVGVGVTALQTKQALAPIKSFCERIGNRQNGRGDGDGGPQL